MCYDVMSLLDFNNPIYLLTPEKKFSKDALMTNTVGKVLGKLITKSRISGKFILKDQSNSLVLEINKKISWKNQTELIDSNKVSLGIGHRINEKNRDREIYFENSQKEEILRGAIPYGNFGHDIYDSNGDVIGSIYRNSKFLEEKFNAKKNSWCLEIRNNNFNRKILLGFFILVFLNYSNPYVDNFLKHPDYG